MPAGSPSLPASFPGATGSPSPPQPWSRVGKQAAFLAREQVRLELGNVLVQLHAAMATDDLAQGQNLRDRYQQLGPR